MAAPKGNTNAKRGARWRNALEREIDDDTLAEIARVVRGLALSGDKDAIREIADRFDGKPQQSIHMEHSVSEMPDEHVESRITYLLGKAGTADAAAGAAAAGEQTTH